eukprot:gene11966-12109_t
MSQVSAIANCCLHKLSLVHGPPGTGKTTTTVALLAQLVRRFQLPFPLLAVAQSHVAVDNLLEGLVDAGVPAVRVGQPVKVRDALRGATLDALLERHPRAQQLEQQEQQLRELRSCLHTLSGRDRGLGHRDCSILGAQLATARDEVMKDVLAGARVICATCAASGSDILAGVTFPVVVLDEASQAAEPEALIPLTRGASHAVLVGDHMQLPPVCNSPEAAAAGLSESLFERLMAAGVPSAMLQVQYRMHPCLSAFPNQAFYGGRLIDGVSAAARPAPAAFPWPQQDLPVLFVDVAEGQEEVASGGSKLNRAEAQVVKQVGFLEDWRRLNVAITRPRRGLVLVGNAATLSAGDERWRTYLSWLRSGGFVVAAPQLFATLSSNGRR